MSLVLRLARQFQVAGFDPGKLDLAVAMTLDQLAPGRRYALPLRVGKQKPFYCCRYSVGLWLDDKRVPAVGD